jgi:hypothetical protein
MGSAIARPRVVSFFGEAGVSGRTLVLGGLAMALVVASGYTLDKVGLEFLVSLGWALLLPGIAALAGWLTSASAGPEGLTKRFGPFTWRTDRIDLVDAEEVVNRVVFRDADGKVRQAFDLRWWRREAVQELAVALGIPVRGSVIDPASGAEHS